MIKVLYFAALREQLGTASEQLELDPQLTDLSALTARLQQRGGAWEEALGGGQSLLVAVNSELASPQTPLSDGDEVAYFPPVTGG
ncbi:MAG: molybdopterin converting factor subunit 1 [Gammaproteobacteria bacterium]|jgi:molybdopterin synthase sulfur carrier subunit